MIIHVSTKSADYWACDTLGEVNLHQQYHRPIKRYWASTCLLHDKNK